MVNTSQPLTLSQENTDCLFPFHLLINSQLIIESCGSSLQKLHGNCISNLFTETFQLIRPVEVNITFKVLCGLVNKLVLLKTSNCCDNTTLIKGQFTYIEKDDRLFFTGTPWFNSIEELRKTGLMVNDFPHNNPTIDLLYLLKTEEIINQDLNLLVSTINEQKNKLKKGEEQILISLHKEKELNQLKSNFVSLASHEFRTPLACIRSSIELMQINLSRPSTQLKDTLRHHNNIVSEIDNLSKLIDEVLTVGKIESDTFSCKKESVNFTLTLLKIIENLNSIQDDERVITFIEDANCLPVMADPLLLKHILNNLISNAFKYSKGKKQPIVKITFEKENVLVQIVDFGIGIPFHQQGKIFQAFFRAENVDQIKGTGLGMFITKNFIELHDGQITFKSIPEKGTEFLMCLPIN